MDRSVWPSNITKTTIAYMVKVLPRYSLSLQSENYTLVTNESFASARISGNSNSHTFLTKSVNTVFENQLKMSNLLLCFDFGTKIQIVISH